MRNWTGHKQLKAPPLGKMVLCHKGVPFVSSHAGFWLEEILMHVKSFATCGVLKEFAECRVSGIFMTAYLKDIYGSERPVFKGGRESGTGVPMP